MQEKENILKILKGTKEAIRKEDFNLMRELSNRTINSVSLIQDPDDIAVVVIVYSLSKIFERKRYRQYPGWDKFYRTIISSIDNSIRDIEKEDFKKFSYDIEEIRKAINKLSGKLKKYIEEVFRRASVNKASRIYEHGISMEKTAKLLGITMYELASYTGQTRISDVVLCETCDVKSRIKLAMEMFR